MNPKQVPLVVLGGSDAAPAELPPSGQGKRPLTGCKGVDLQIHGTPLIAELCRRLMSTGRFSKIFIAGPAEAYRGIVPDAELVDTDADFGTNIQAAVEAVRRKCPDGHVAFSTCDILPSTTDLASSFEDFDRTPDADLWFPIIEVSEEAQDLGASAWKPRYRLHLDGRAVPVLPGHVVIADPDSLRLELMYRLLRSAYRTRNRPIFVRRAVILRYVILGILYHDLLHLLRLRLPTLMWDIVITGWKGARMLRDQTLTQGELERRLRQLFIKRAHRRRHPDRRVRIPVLGALSLARDIDTVEEAESIGVTSAPATT